MLDVQRLLSQADSLRAMLVSVWIVQRLLPQAGAQFLLARAGRAALRVVLRQVRSASPHKRALSNQDGDGKGSGGFEIKSAMTAVVG
jgi:hypothetical protein